MKKLILSSLIGLMMLIGLVGCSQEPPEQFRKTSGEVVDKDSSGGRSTSYYVEVSYPVSNGKFAIDQCYVDKELYNDIQLKDKVTVYVNKKGIGEVTK